MPSVSDSKKSIAAFAAIGPFERNVAELQHADLPIDPRQGLSCCVITRHEHGANFERHVQKKQHLARFAGSDRSGLAAGLPEASYMRVVAAWRRLWGVARNVKPRASCVFRGRSGRPGSVSGDARRQACALCASRRIPVGMLLPLQHADDSAAWSHFPPITP